MGKYSEIRHLDGAETGEIDDGCLELNNSEVCMNIEAFEEVGSGKIRK